jgi:hypothetical protein
MIHPSVLFINLGTRTVYASYYKPPQRQFSNLRSVGVCVHEMALEYFDTKFVLKYT